MRLWAPLILGLLLAWADPSAAQLQLVINNVIRILPGFLASSFMIGTFLSLYLARWWQATIYNPGGFGKEFRALNLGKTTALVAMAIALVATLVEGQALADTFYAMMLVVFQKSVRSS